MLACDISELNRPSSAPPWDGPFATGDRFVCSAVVPGMPVGGLHIHRILPTATGADSGEPAIEIGDPDWIATVSSSVSSSPPSTATAPTVRSAPTTAAQAVTGELPPTGNSEAFALLALAASVAGAVLVGAEAMIIRFPPDGEAVVDSPHD